MVYTCGLRVVYGYSYKIIIIIINTRRSDSRPCAHIPHKLFYDVTNNIFDYEDSISRATHILLLCPRVRTICVMKSLAAA